MINSMSEDLRIACPFNSHHDLSLSRTAADRVIDTVLAWNAIVVREAAIFKEECKEIEKSCTYDMRLVLCGDYTSEGFGDRPLGNGILFKQRLHGEKILDPNLVAHFFRSNLIDPYMRSVVPRLVQHNAEHEGKCANENNSNLVSLYDNVSREQQVNGVSDIITKEDVRIPIRRDTANSEEDYASVKALWLCNSGIHPRDQIEMFKMVFRNYNKEHRLGFEARLVRRHRLQVSADMVLSSKSGSVNVVGVSNEAGKRKNDSVMIRQRTAKDSNHTTRVKHSVYGHLTIHYSVINDNYNARNMLMSIRRVDRTAVENAVTNNNKSDESEQI
ncbi:hypothetical protein O3P69_010274 [Scylla paramamosain]|uniref:Uncharacterized protein n=1 Tax=Scylla paramamosain TaxID=85552 RepID=A0AAW0TSK2_SCYPA